MTLFERLMIWTSTAVMGLSGVIYAVMKYFMSTDDPYAVVNHPLQPLVLKIHIVAAPVFVFAVGAVFTRHIWKQWRNGVDQGRRSGVWSMLTIFPMIVSGYLIQTVTVESVLFWLVAVHLVTSAVFLAGYAIHQVVTPNAAERKNQNGDMPLLLKKGRTSPAHGGRGDLAEKGRSIPFS